MLNPQVETQDFPNDPLDLFNEWFQEAGGKEQRDPNAMALATVDAEGRPSLRMVLLKGLIDQEFVFYTNLMSRKGQSLVSNPNASLLFYWKSLNRQIQIEGQVYPVTPQEADYYFTTRPIGAQIGAWASLQSQPLESRDVLESRMADYSLKFGDEPVPRPPHWSGFRLNPLRMEFWEERPFRLHDRILYQKEADIWSVGRLYP